jgi:hypothetical protein
MQPVLQLANVAVIGAGACVRTGRVPRSASTSRQLPKASARQKDLLTSWQAIPLGHLHRASSRDRARLLRLGRPCEYDGGSSALHLQQLPRIGHSRQRPRLHALCDAAHALVGQLVARSQPERCRRLGLPACRAPARHAITRDLSRALPRRPAPEHFLYVDHGQLPKAHGCLPTASCAVVGKHPA